MSPLNIFSVGNNCPFVFLGFQESTKESRNGKHSTDVQISTARSTQTHQENQLSDRTLSMPKYPQYVTVTARLESFTTCVSIAVPPKTLSLAGFFYAGMEDCTKCFYCAIGKVWPFVFALMFSKLSPLLIS